MPLSRSEGRDAVALARAAMEDFVSGREASHIQPPPGVFDDARGVFVTLKTRAAGSEELRGCIGFPYPVKSLGRGIVDAAVAASSEDPRFPPVSQRELPSILVEVSILTRPEPLEADTPAGRASALRVGEDGLIVSRPPYSGLLLPQVATEFDMDGEEFLSQACLKAGLRPDAWLESSTEVLRFQAEVFCERAPGGDVVKVEPTRAK